VPQSPHKPQSFHELHSEPGIWVTSVIFAPTPLLPQYEFCCPGVVSPSPWLPSALLPPSPTFPLVAGISCIQDVPSFQPSSKGVQDYCVLALLFWMLWIKFSFTHCCLYYSDNSDSQVPTCDKSFHNYFLHNNCVPAITIHITVFGIMTPTTDVHFMGLSKILFISVYILVTSKHVMYIV
jgi:hypothetical protein